jgi:hypothetical protein
MYYITNHNDQVIAASSSLLEYLQVDSIDTLYRQIARDAIEFVPENVGVTIKTALDEVHYSSAKETLSSLLGNMTLVQLLIQTPVTESLESPILPSEEEELQAPAPIEEDEEILFDIKEEEEETPPAVTETTALMEEESVPQAEEEDQEEDDLYNLILPSNAEETIHEMDEIEGTPTANAPVYIDVAEISQSIGISPDDYNTFLTEYIDTALSLEDDLKSDEKSKRTAATHTLFHLSNVLRIPVITEIIEQLKYTEEDDIESSIQSFYDTLSRLTTVEPETALPDTATAPLPEAEEKGVEEETSEGFGTIDLSDVKPIHFDFQLNEAANELSLPEELIEEFIHDFIKQAHEETDKMLQAYQKGDLETIQKIGHLLKGTSSNLRINPLADTLYEIQFCDDSSKLEALIKEYWGHFLAFETQFNLKSQQEKGN